MKTVSIRDAKNRLTELAREVEEGETVVVTRNGRPVLGELNGSIIMSCAG